MKIRTWARRFVIYSDEAGVYLGNAMGLGFWSKWDPVGQNAAVTFPTADAAAEHVASWGGSPPAGTRSVPVMVEVDEPTADAVKARPEVTAVYATIAECVEAGLPAWDTSITPASAEFPQDIPSAGQFDKASLAQWRKK